MGLLGVRGEEHNSMLSANGEIEIDVTCESVYLTFNDDSNDPGMAFNHDEFEEIINHYNETVSVESDSSET